MTTQVLAAPNKPSTTNIFHEALMLLSTRNGQGMSDEERETVSTAIIPLMLLPQYSDIPIGEGLEDLDKMVEEAK
jgi:hypothetical protein